MSITVMLYNGSYDVLWQTWYDRNLEHEDGKCTWNWELSSWHYPESLLTGLKLLASHYWSGFHRNERYVALGMGWVANARYNTSNLNVETNLANMAVIIAVLFVYCASCNDAHPRCQFWSVLCLTRIFNADYSSLTNRLLLPGGDQWSTFCSVRRRETEEQPLVSISQEIA